MLEIMNEHQQGKISEVTDFMCKYGIDTTPADNKKYKEVTR